MSQNFSRTKWTRIVTAAGLALALSGPALAGPAGGHKPVDDMCGPMGKQMSRLSVSGQGEARTAPDLAVIQLGVDTQADSASAAMKQNSEQQAAVIDALKDAGIEAKNIQTSGLNLNPMVDYGEDRKAKVLGYQASNTVSVRVTDIANLGEVLDAVVSAGANNINGINFQREDSQSVEDDARRAAVEDARHKAEVMAEAAGMTLGPIMHLRDAPAQSGPQPMMMRAAEAKDSSTPVEAGELAVTSEVQVDFALLGADCEEAGGEKPETPDANEGGAEESPASN